MPSSSCLILFALGVLLASVSGAENSETVTTVKGADTKPKTTSTTEPITTSSSTSAPLTSSTTNGTSTTAAPTSSTTSSTTAPPTTTPPPHVKEGVWVLRDPATGQVCLVAQMKIQLDIPYTNSSGQVVMAHVKVPGNATGTGKCSSSNLTLPQSLALTWGSPNYTSVLTLTFNSNRTDKQFWLDSIAAVVSVDNSTFPDARVTVKQVKMVNSTKHFVTPMDNSYNCPAVRNIPARLTPPVQKASAAFTLDHFQLEAFKNSTKEDFSNSVYCDGDNTPDLVPILVGCTLVALVVIVLAVYLWGRRRSQARGYLSM